MRSVEILISSDKLSSAMGLMRIWMDTNKIDAHSFRYYSNADGMAVVVLTFEDVTDANAFANAFNGKLR